MSEAPPIDYIDTDDKLFQRHALVVVDRPIRLPDGRRTSPHSHFSNGVAHLSEADFDRWLKWCKDQIKKGSF